MAKQVTKMECGLAFAKFSLSKDRIERNGLKSIPEYDVRTGLNTTAGVVAMIENSIPEHLKPEMKVIQSGAKRLVNQLSKGPKEIKAEDAPKLLVGINKISKKLGNVMSKIEKSCH
jgi:hypothetical protein